jgi:plasmid stability protein
MKRTTLILDDSLHAEIKERAKRNGRSLQKEIVAVLEGTVSVPMVGKIQEDGTVKFDNYWNTPEGIEQSR